MRKEALEALLVEVFDDLAARFILTCPVEEFSSFDRLFFQIEAAHWFYIDNYVEHDKSLPNMGMRDFTRRLFLHCPMLVSFQSKVEEYLKGFSQYKVGVPVYGCIILDPTLTYCLLVKGWGKSTTWTFPKGKVNEGEDEMHAAAREVFEEVGFDCTPLIREKDVLKITINDHAMSLYIVPGVPRTTIFETQTCKEISAIEWFKVDDLPASKTPGSSFYLVTPFVRLIQDWITFKRSGKFWHPARGDRSNSQSKRSETPQKKDQTPAKKDGQGKQRATSTPHQRPGTAAQDEDSTSAAQVQILKRGGEADGEVDETVTAGGKGRGGGAARTSANDLGELSRGNLTMSKDFKFDWVPIVKSLEMT